MYFTERDSADLTATTSTYIYLPHPDLVEGVRSGVGNNSSTRNLNLNLFIGKARYIKSLSNDDSG